jgi:hypothetical protein
MERADVKAPPIPSAAPLDQEAQAAAAGQSIPSGVTDKAPEYWWRKYRSEVAKRVQVEGQLNGALTSHATALAAAALDADYDLAVAEDKLHDTDLRLAEALGELATARHHAGTGCVACGSFWTATGYGKPWHRRGCPARLGTA